MINFIFIVDGFGVFGGDQFYRVVALFLRKSSTPRRYSPTCGTPDIFSFQTGSSSFREKYVANFAGPGVYLFSSRRSSS